MIFERQIRYYYLRFIRLRGGSHELALGMAFGIFAGMMPIVPIQTAVAVALAIFFKGSKITAAVGTWVSNPLNWPFLYYYNHKLGAFLLGLPENSEVFSSVMIAIKSGEKWMAIAGKILGAGGVSLAAFLLGGLIMGIVLSVPSYFIFFRFFRYIKTWRESRRARRN